MNDSDPQSPSTATTEALLRSGLEQLKQGLEQLLASPANDAVRAPASPAVPAASEPTVVSDLLGFTPEALREQPQLLEEALNRFFGSARSLLTAIASDEPDGLAAARQQMATLRETLARHEILLPAGFEALPQRLREATRQEQTVQRGEIATALEALAAALQGTATAAGDVLQQKAGDLRREEEPAGHDPMR